MTPMAHPGGPARRARARGPLSTSASGGCAASARRCGTRGAARSARGRAAAAGEPWARPVRHRGAGAARATVVGVDLEPDQRWASRRPPRGARPGRAQAAGSRRSVVNGATRTTLRPSRRFSSATAMIAAYRAGPGGARQAEGRRGRRTPSRSPTTAVRSAVAVSRSSRAAPRRPASRAARVLLPDPGGPVTTTASGRALMTDGRLLMQPRPARPSTTAASSRRRGSARVVSRSCRVSCETARLSFHSDRPAIAPRGAVRDGDLDLLDERLVVDAGGQHGPRHTVGGRRHRRARLGRTGVRQLEHLGAALHRDAGRVGDELRERRLVVGLALVLEPVGEDLDDEQQPLGLARLHQVADLVAHPRARRPACPGACTRASWRRRRRARGRSAPSRRRRSA